MTVTRTRHKLRTRVYDGNLNNNAPEALDQWTCQEIHRYANSPHDYCVLRRELDREHETITDMRCDAMLKTSNGEQNQYVCVWEVDDEDKQVRPLFWGELVQNTLVISAAGEAIIAKACLRDHHFGVPIIGQQCWDEFNKASLPIHLDPVFNPLVDGLIMPNKQGLLTHADSPGQADVPYHLWIDPESSRTEEAQALRGTTVGAASGDYVDYWSLHDAVKTVCEELNGAWFNIQIRNPVHDEGSGEGYFVITVPDNPLDDGLVNLRIKRGSYLPAILDTLLKPYRYGWYVKLADPQHTTELPLRQVDPRIEFYRIGAAPTEQVPAKQLKLQAQHEDLDPDQSNTMELMIDFDMSNTANEVDAFGSLKQREVTLDLYKGWAEAEDVETDTTLDGPFPNLWRKFVCNEAGDYDGLRPEISNEEDLDIFDNPDSTAFNYTIPKRREIEEPLKYRSGAEEMLRHPIFVEYSTDNGASYDPVPETWGYRVLQNEIGIMFTGEEVPRTLKAAGANAKIRITGTITGDLRVRGTADQSTSSALTDKVIKVVDLSHRYHDRQVSTDFAYQSDLTTATDAADTADDEAALLAFAEYLRDESEHARLKISAKLSDILTEYEIGDMLDEVEGRGIDLSTKADGAEAQRYPQIQSIGYNLDENTTSIEAEA